MRLEAEKIYIENAPRSGTLTAMRFTVQFLALAISIINLTACGNTPSWFIGKFVFDPPETAKSVASDGLSNDEKAFKIMLEMDVGIDKPTLTISSNEIISQLNGSGTSDKYEVFEKLDEKTIVIKKTDGEIQTWHKTEKGIATPGLKGKVMMQFKRLN